MIFIKRDDAREWPSLVLSTFVATPSFNAVKEHVALAADSEDGPLIAVLGPAEGVNTDLSERYARLFSAAPAGLAAAELALAWMHDPAENVTERFDRVADEFHRETGFTRPGRSRPVAMGAGPSEAEVRDAWDAWCVARNEKVRLALVAFVAKARGG